MVYTLSPELYHHGIKGMRWGVRRYQNPDGSLTAAGEKRYGTAENYNRVRNEQHKKRMARVTRSAEGLVFGRDVRRKADRMQKKDSSLSREKAMAVARHDKYGKRTYIGAVARGAGRQVGTVALGSLAAVTVAGLAAYKGHDIERGRTAALKVGSAIISVGTYAGWAKTGRDLSNIHNDRTVSRQAIARSGHYTAQQYKKRV